MWPRSCSKASLVYDLRMQPAPVEGELVIEAGTGRIHSTLLRVRLGAVRAELTTTYEHDERLDILVPARFRESYEDGTERATDVSIVSQEHHERIFVESTYTNYRRFSATGRIK